jgi:hypothetical protein
MDQLQLNFGDWAEPPERSNDGVLNEFVRDFEIFQGYVNEFVENRFGSDQGLYEQAVICAVHSIGVMLRLGSTDEDIIEFFKRMLSHRDQLLVPCDYRSGSGPETNDAESPTLRGAVTNHKE